MAKQTYVLIDGVWTPSGGPPGTGIPPGGLSGQVLAKNSNTDYDTHWVTGGGGGGFSNVVTGDFTVHENTAAGEMVDTLFQVETSPTPNSITLKAREINAFRPSHEGGGAYIPTQQQHVATKAYVDSVSFESGNIIVVNDLSEIPLGTPSGTVVVVSAGAPPPPASFAPVVVSTSIGGIQSGTDLTISKPIGTSDGDYLVAFVASQSSTFVSDVVLPAGWSRICWPFVSPPGSEMRYNSVFGKRILNNLSETSSYVFQFEDGNTSRLIGAIVAVSRVNTSSNPVDSFNGPVSSATPLSAQLPATTVLTDNALAFAFVHTVQTAGNSGVVSSITGGWESAVTNTVTTIANGSSDSISVFVSDANKGPIGGTISIPGPSVSADAEAIVVLRGI